MRKNKKNILGFRKLNLYVGQRVVVVNVLCV